MDKIEIINRISQLRTRANLSARALSLSVGLSSCYINRLESKKDFLPSLEVLLDIIEACGSTTEEFFYKNPLSYKKDMEIIDLLSRADEDTKTAILTLLKK